SRSGRGTLSGSGRLSSQGPGTRAARSKGGGGSRHGRGRQTFPLEREGAAGGRAASKGARARSVLERGALAARRRSERAELPAERGSARLRARRGGATSLDGSVREGRPARRRSVLGLPRTGHARLARDQDSEQGPPGRLCPP